mmetsp:Transcript_29355/g.71545  ORF Transcript_29355/g.71545 Transcript_29355/m.71545 type:complete len:372 (-) Transcript_29355:316-1431(-)
MYMSTGKGGLAAVMFGKYDTDKSGTISATEFQGLCYNLDHALTDEEVKVAVKVLNKSGSGEIKREEFLEWWKQGSRRWTDIELDAKELKVRVEAAKAFKECDEDGSGSIDKKEYEKFFESLKQHNLTQAPKEDVFRALDADGNGTIQFYEYVRWLNKTGTITMKMLPAVTPVKLRKVGLRKTKTTDKSGISSRTQVHGQIKKSGAGGVQLRSVARPSDGLKPHVKAEYKKEKQEIRHKHLNKFGKKRAGLEDEIDRKNQEYKDRAEWKELLKYKQKFLDIDTDGSGDLDEMEILKFLNQASIKDKGKPWTVPKIKSKILNKYGVDGKMRYDGFLRWILGDDMGRVLRLKLKFEKLASESAKPVVSKPKKLW